MSFNSFNLHPQVAEGVRTAGYAEPTPIQKQSIPTIMQGRDVMGLAQTGTGKTAAFALPILHKLLKGQRGHVRALIVAPTRELAEQIHESIGSLAGKTGLRSVTVYGGVNMNPQITRLKRGVEIVVACPGRLLDHMKQNTIDLSQLDVLVLDEADRMFDMGFLPDIRRIIKQLPQKRQTLLFSATMPKEIRHLAHEVLRDPETVQVDTVAPATTVSHALYPVSQHLKTDLLLKLLEHTDTESVLIFTRTKHRAKRLGQKLEKKGYRAASLQGNLSQSRRQAALNGFRDGSFQVLVATDIAARGIDVSQVSHVINFDIPDTAEAYIHRIGRTGRAARSGDAFTMVTNEDKAMVRTIERTLGNSLERRKLDGFDYTLSAPERPSRSSKATHKPLNKKAKTAQEGKPSPPSDAKNKPSRRSRSRRTTQPRAQAPAAR
jgi:ATP-dependent RNA helicase RhlE